MQTDRGDHGRRPFGFWAPSPGCCGSGGYIAIFVELEPLLGGIPLAPRLILPMASFPSRTIRSILSPCTNSSILPLLGDLEPQNSWEKLFDPNPDHWSWGQPSSNSTFEYDPLHPYAGRGIYMCGWLDLPLDYLNSSEARVVRLAITKYQVRGLAHRTSLNAPHVSSRLDHKTERTIIVEPGGPGSSGTVYTWMAAEEITARFSDGQFDVLGWDPRGVNASLPAVSCFPRDAVRDRWALYTTQYRKVSSPMQQLEISDAMNNATYYACWQRFGDFGRFIGTASAARDLDEIRKALGEDELTGYFVSYGTAIAQTYANIFPLQVGRGVLDANLYVKDLGLFGGYARAALANTIDIWRDGFLGECINAGPELCALANSMDNQGPVTIAQLEARVFKILDSLTTKPIPAYTEKSGPFLITYSRFVRMLKITMANPSRWPGAAKMLYDLEAGNITLAAASLDFGWGYDPTIPSRKDDPISQEIISLVLCADAFDVNPPEDGLLGLDQLWLNMTSQSWIAGDGGFYEALSCRHYTTYWPRPSEVYRGDLNSTLNAPVLLISMTYDPATPIRNGRRLLQDMGKNARLIVQHGYGHGSTSDRSDCTDKISKTYILHGTLPIEQETECYANKKPYAKSIMYPET